LGLPVLRKKADILGAHGGERLPNLMKRPRKAPVAQGCYDEYIGAGEKKRDIPVGPMATARRPRIREVLAREKKKSLGRRKKRKTVRARVGKGKSVKLR